MTARMDPGVTAAITRISEHAWVGIKYPEAIWEEEEEEQRWISEALSEREQAPRGVPARLLAETDTAGV